MPPVTRLFFLLTIAIYCGRAQSAALDFQAGQSDPLSSQYLTDPLVLASDTNSEPVAELPIVSAANAGSGEPAEAALSKDNGLLSPCSSNNKRDSATKPAWCKPETQLIPSTQPVSTPPVQEFTPEGKIQNSNANKKTPWWEKIPGASRLFRQPGSNAIPPEFEQNNICNDPDRFYIFPVCSMQTPYNPGLGTTLLLNHCRSYPQIGCDDLEFFYCCKFVRDVSWLARPKDPDYDWYQKYPLSGDQCRVTVAMKSLKLIGGWGH